MPPSESLREAERVMTICNACRYCEGFCAVFPAMELHRTFTAGDLKYLSNLCHNCRGCYYACQYAPPHEFNLNVPKTLGALRFETYREFVFPRVMGNLFRRNGRVTLWVTTLSIALVMIVTVGYQGTSGLFGSYRGENAFYRVIPYELLVVPILVLGIGVLVSLMIGVIRFWLGTGGTLGKFASATAHRRALLDVARLKYLDGGGQGCNYPDDRFSMSRRWLHHLVFYGFTSALTATSTAAVYHHFLHWPAPYPVYSLPVALGILGGIGMLTGTAGLLYLKTKMDKAPAYSEFAGMDIGFLMVLMLVNLTGFLVLVFREAPLMGLLLILHIGVVMGLFVLMPFGKFVHGIFRYAALLRNAIEISKSHT